MALVVVGASTLGRSAVGIAQAQHRTDVIGFVDDRPLNLTSVDGVPFLGSTGTLYSLFERFCDFELIIAIGDPLVRSQVHQRIVESFPNIRFATLVHPQSTLLGKVTIGDGSMIFPGVVLGPGSRVGRSSVINANATVGAGATIEEFVSIGPGANLGSDCILERGTFVGMGAAIAQQVRIGGWCTVGALSFVRQSAPARSLVVGIPATISERRK